jgi:hypothetical protein
MIQLKDDEFEFLRSQFATTKLRKARVNPYVFTEHGALMAGNVINSKRAIRTSVTVIRAFVQLRTMMRNDELTKIRLDDLEDRLGAQEFQALAVLDQLGAIKKQLQPSKSKKTLIGFRCQKK